MSADQKITLRIESEQNDAIDLMICRACKGGSGEFLTLDSYIDEGVILCEIFNEYCRMDAEIGDHLPQMLCQACARDLKIIRAFVQKAKKADYEFRAELNGTNIGANSMKRCEIGGLRKGQVDNGQTLLDSPLSPVCYSRDSEVANEIEFLTDIEDDKLEVLYDAIDSNSSSSMLEINNTIKNELPSDGLNQDNLCIESESEKETMDGNGEDKKDYACCNLCEIEFFNLDSLQEHMLLNHSNQKILKSNYFKCEKCEKRFKTSQKLKQHDFVHTRSKAYECPICLKRFATIYRKRDHLRMHANERNFSCEYCDKRFTTRSSLRVHLPLHTGERPHKCDICGKSFVQRSVLITHMALHTGKTHKCPHCPKMFSRSSQLILHQRSHTGERPYKCSKCDSAYFQKSHLDRHVGLHLGIRFKCEKCDKVYTAKSTLMTHEQEEHGSTLYKCNECNLNFAKKKSFQYHMKTKHSIGKQC